MPKDRQQMYKPVKFFEIDIIYLRMREQEREREREREIIPRKEYYYKYSI
jgi:hypothetical protein